MTVRDFEKKVTSTFCLKDPGCFAQKVPVTFSLPGDCPLPEWGSYSSVAPYPLEGSFAMGNSSTVPMATRFDDTESAMPLIGQPVNSLFPCTCVQGG